MNTSKAILIVIFLMLLIIIFFAYTGIDARKPEEAMYNLIDKAYRDKSGYKPHGS